MDELDFQLGDLVVVPGGLMGIVSGFKNSYVDVMVDGDLRVPISFRRTDISQRIGPVWDYLDLDRVSFVTFD